jgi:predicted nicotinamide N-methyase
VSGPATTGPGGGTDVAAFIRTHLPLREVPGLPGIRLHLATPASRLGRLAAETGSDAPPYWAYLWGGGLALAHHIRAHPDTLAGRRVLDFGAGSGLVGIVAAQAGAARVFAAERDPNGRAALTLNAAANGITVELQEIGPGADAPPVDLVLAGDVFYAPEIAARSLALLTLWQNAGIEVLIGDPFRRDLPLERLRLIAEYEAADFGSGRALTRSGVFRLEPGPS